MDKVRLDLVGITYNQIESGVYAVILQEHGGTRRIPIIIGFPEAQAIECKLQEVVTPRPLTHDLMVNIMSAYGIMLEEVNIHKLPNGVFAAELVIQDSNSTRVIDSRSSDAIALAIRVGAPIYTTRRVLDEAGFEPSGSQSTKADNTATASAESEKELQTKSIETLKNEMQKAAEAEDYEQAARLKNEIERRERNTQDEK